MTTRSASPRSSTPCSSRSANRAADFCLTTKMLIVLAVAGSPTSCAARSPSSSRDRANEERIAAYVIREHERGRALHDILEDPYLRNRCTPEQLARLLDRPEIVHALGESTVAAARRNSR